MTGETVLTFETDFGTVQHKLRKYKELDVEFVISRDFPDFLQLWKKDNSPDNHGGSYWEK